MPRPPPAHCRVPGCDRPSRAGGLCTSHYGQQRRGQPLRPIQSPQPRRVRVVAYLPPDVAQRLRDAAEARGVAVAEQLREVVEAWVPLPCEHRWWPDGDSASHDRPTTTRSTTRSTTGAGRERRRAS